MQIARRPRTTRSLRAGSAPPDARSKPGSQPEPRRRAAFEGLRRKQPPRRHRAAEPLDMCPWHSCAAVGDSTHAAWRTDEEGDCRARRTCSANAADEWLEGANFCRPGAVAVSSNSSRARAAATGGSGGGWWAAHRRLLIVTNCFCWPRKYQTCLSGCQGRKSLRAKKIISPCSGPPLPAVAASLFNLFPEKSRRRRHQRRCCCCSTSSSAPREGASAAAAAACPHRSQWLHSLTLPPAAMGAAVVAPSSTTAARRKQREYDGRGG